MNKQAFIDQLNGLPVARDMFGKVMHKGDWLAWGGGASVGSGIHFGRITKINYSKENWNTKKNEKVTSVTCEHIIKPHSWDLKDYANCDIIDGYVKSKRKQAIQNFASGWVLDQPPKIAKQLLDPS